MKKTIKPKIMKITVWFFRGIDLVHKPIEKFLHILTNISRLSEKEIEAASKVLGADSIRYDAVRVAEGRLLRLIFRFNGQRPFVTFHTINFYKPRDNSSKHLSTMVHELTHVFQFEVIGSVYLWQALRVQWAFRDKAYKYGGWKGLAANRNEGWHFRDYCREQQAQIAQDYYSEVIEKERLPEAPIRQAFEPFINELRNGEL
jgi:hypothetical protein